LFAIENSALPVQICFEKMPHIFERLEAWIGAAEAAPIRSEREKKKNEREN
jgi:hypothetical protein